MQFKVNALHEKFGVEVLNADLTGSLSHQVISQFNDLLNHHKLVIFRNQSLSPEQQIALGKQLGEIELHPADPVPWKYRELTYVANTDLEQKSVFEHCGPHFELWHSDTCYLPEPARMSLLYAERVPTASGETLFADMQGAYTDLPTDVKEQLEGKFAVFGSGFNLMQRCQAKGYNLQIPDSEIGPDVIHPVFRTHPYTREKSIYVNWAHTDRILGIAEKESEALLSFIYQHCRQDKYVYTHFPKKADLIVWDNASLIHSNTDKKLNDIRIMRRVMIKGSKPF